MKSLYRVVERRPSVFVVEKRSLWWITVLDTDRAIRVVRTWETKEGAENWIKRQIPFDAFRPRVVSEWFITGAQKPNGK